MPRYPPFNYQKQYTAQTKSFLNSITDSFLIVAAPALHVQTVEKGTIVLYTKHLSVDTIIILSQVALVTYLKIRFHTRQKRGWTL
jgi:hypothetical protein